MKEAFPVVATESEVESQELARGLEESRRNASTAKHSVEAAYLMILGDSALAPESYVYNYHGGRGAE